MTPGPREICLVLVIHVMDIFGDEMRRTQGSGPVTCQMAGVMLDSSGSRTTDLGPTCFA